MSLFILIFIANAFLTITSNIQGSCYTIRNITVALNGGLDNPLWSVQENALYWVDNYNQILFRMDANGAITSRNVCYGIACFIIPVQDYPGYVVVAIRTSLYLLRWGAPGGDAALRQLTTVDTGNPDNTIDDGKVDPNGRLWFGTLGKFDFSIPGYVVPDQGNLYMMDDCNYADPEIKKRPVTWADGIAWSRDNTTMYFVDSSTRRISAFDYDVTTAAIGNETVIFRFDDYDIPGVPDGILIDGFGNLWVATFDSYILKINPNTGALLQQIQMPVDRVSSMTWGGPNLDIMYVTTSGLGLANPMPLSGALFEISDLLDTDGVADNLYYFPGASEY